jgi:hypothetical protein
MLPLAQQFWPRGVKGLLLKSGGIQKRSDRPESRKSGQKKLHDTVGDVTGNGAVQIKLRSVSALAVAFDPRHPRES